MSGAAPALTSAPWREGRSPRPVAAKSVSVPRNELLKREVPKFESEEVRSAVNDKARAHQIDEKVKAKIQDLPLIHI